MKKKTQKFFGVILFIFGLSLIFSAFIPELIKQVPISIVGTDLISIYIGVILCFIGYSGIKKKW